MDARSNEVSQFVSCLSSEELRRRPSRAPDYAAESRALVALARHLAAAPETILQKLADTALELCRAHSAGFSLLTDDGNRFYWAAIAGLWARHLGGGTPRDFGPCGTVLDRNAPMLFWHPEQRFEYLTEATPFMDEGLLLPFYVGGKPVGTIWIISHDPSCRFDAEDERVMRSLAEFASAAYQAHRDSKHRLRHILDALPAAIYTTDAEGRITDYNRAAMEIAGRIPQVGDDTWCVSWKLYHPDGRPLPHDQCPMAVALKDQRDIRGAEIIIERPDGQRVAAAAYPTMLRDPDGRMIGGVNMLVDITQRKEVEDRLKETEERLRGVFSQAIAGIAQTDLTGRFVEVNARYCEIVGRSAAELYGLRMGDITHPDDLARNMELFVPMVEGRGGPFVIEKRYVRPSGEVVWVSNSVSLIRDRNHQPKHVVAVSLDVTDRRHADVMLRRQNERLQLLWQTTAVLLTTDEPDAMLRALFNRIRDSLMLDVYFNHMVVEPGNALHLVSYTGASEEMVREIAQTQFGDAICGNVAVRRAPIIAEAIQESADPMVQAVKRCGIRAYVCNPLIAAGRLLGTLSFASRQRDRFERDEIEFLETISQYVTVAYERMRLIEQLRDHDRRKDEFLATLSHELRNPLAPIRNCLEVIRLADGNRAALEQARATAERQVQQLGRLVDDLLDVSRISRNKLELRREPVGLATIVKSAVETSRPLILAASHVLEIDIPQEPVQLDADPVRLAQALSNILNNAAKYSEPNGRIRLSAESRGGELLIRVRDDGIGIPADKLPHIFDLFVQLDESRERAQGGLGIGLTLVKRLVEMHGGAIEVHSEGPGKGSEFTVRLPTLAARNRQRESGAVLQRPASPPRRVLVVDDNVDAAQSLANMLRFSGHEVAIAFGGSEAVNLAQSFRPELALLDLGMAPVSGYEAARRIREHAGDNIILIAVTGWGQDEQQRRSREAGFDFHLVKPVEPSDLERVLATGQRAADAHT